jgi:hypothetical protein
MTIKYADHLLFRISLLALLLFVTVACVPQENLHTLQQGNTTSSEPMTYYSGYSKEFQPYRNSLNTGNLDDVLAKMSQEETKLRATADTDEKFAKKIGLLGLLERTSLCLQAGDIQKSIYYSQMAESVMEDRENESYLSTGLASAGSMFAEASGAGKYGRYDAVGYEKVLLLNLKAMDLLIQGDVRAFNVARLGIQWQADEKEKFEKQIQAFEKESAEKDNENKAPGKEASASDKASLFTAINKEFAKYDAQALKVSSAFVNPFGDFLAGTVNEFKSVTSKALLSNAHISYKQALKLNPDSKVLQLAVKDTKNKRSAANLVQIVAFDGFAPEKQVLKFGVAVKSLSAPLNVEVPTYTPSNSRVKTIKVTTTSGKTLATLSPIANITDLAFRHQKDMLPTVQSFIVSSTLRDALIRETGNRYLKGLGNLVGSALDSTMEPNTASWMSLPSEILGGRFHSPKGLKKIKVITYDEKGKQLSQKIVELSEGDRHLVFIRSIDNILAVYPSKTIWSQK